MYWLKIIATTVTAGTALILATVPASAYTVRPGDTLWSIYRRTGVPISVIAQRNHLADINLIRIGQQLILPAPQTAPAPGPRQLLVQAAHEEGVDPALVLAVSEWESGQNQAAVSADGAVGLMQIMPSTAAWAGPHLLGHQVDVHDPAANALIGAALLARYLKEFGGDEQLALAAYYQGPTSVRKHGIEDSSRPYVKGILDLRQRTSVPSS
ncbi:MAG TPA: transglycosylase SLT domain-containing protein [Candidatus Nitrosotalea sp.]|nr:transglycosylase SLT domain-containing protein [Candidatus Nitrosotalea sp.]